MLLPRFTLRHALGVVTALCVFFFVVSFAVRGHPWAVAVSIVGGALTTLATIFVLVFFLAWLLTICVSLGDALKSLVFGRTGVELQSPFADDRLPPVVVSPPPDPED